MARETLIRRSDFTEPLTIQVETTVDLGGGATDVELTDGTTIMARVHTMKGREYLQARQTVGGVPYQITVDRLGPSIDSDTQFKWESRTGARTLHVASPPAPTNDGDFLTFMAFELDE